MRVPSLNQLPVNQSSKVFICDACHYRQAESPAPNRNKDQQREQQEQQQSQQQPPSQQQHQLTVLCSPATTNRFIYCDVTRNFPGGYYHIRKPETSVLTMSVEEWLQCWNTWQHTKLLLQVHRSLLVCLLKICLKHPHQQSHRGLDVRENKICVV